MKRGWIVAVIAAVLIMPAAATADGTNFTYPHKIGWGGSYLDKLAEVFASIDAAFTTTAGDAVQVTDLAATTTGDGASMVGIEDVGGYFTGATNAEAALQLVGPTMTDDRDPNAHAISHATGSTDAIAPGDIGAATAADLTALETQTASYLQMVLDDWDPTNIGAGVVDPPTAIAGDRYIASATEAPYTVWRIYEYNGATWDETTGAAGDLLYHVADSTYWRFNGAMWYYNFDSESLVNFVGDSGAGGTAGLVPAPAAGDAAAGKCLKADGTWAVPPSDPLMADRIRRSTATPQTTTTAVPLKIEFEVSEVTGNVTYLTGDYTIPETGLYTIYSSLTFAGNAGGTERTVALYVGGVVVDDDTAAPDGVNPVTAGAAPALFLTAADVVAVYGLQDSGGDLNVTAGRVAIQRMQ